MECCWEKITVGGKPIIVGGKKYIIGEWKKVGMRGQEGAIYMSGNKQWGAGSGLQEAPNHNAAILIV